MSAGMKKRISEWLESYRCMDWAVLCMRLFAGAGMLFHNIGKIQNYNELIGSYPAPFAIDPPAAFVVATGIEVLLAVLIILGVRVRLSSALVALGILLRFAWGGFDTGEADFVWLGVYGFLALAGGGSYAFDRAIDRSGRKK